MAITFTGGKTWVTGDAATAANLNSIVDSMTLTLATDKLLGRVSASTGNVEEVTCTDFAQSLLDDAAATNALATLGLFQTISENAVTATTQTAGGSGVDLVYSAGPTVSLTTGTWLLLGTCPVRTTDTADAIWLRFRNNTDGADFGYGSAVQEDSTAVRYALSCVGTLTVASGSKDIYLKAFRAATSTLDLGCAETGAVAGSILAIRMY